MRLLNTGGHRHTPAEQLPRICALLGPRERLQVEAATQGRLVILPRTTVSGIYDDVLTGHADGALISVAMVREADLPRLAALVRDLPGSQIVGLVGDDGHAAAIPGSVLLGRAGIGRLVDVRERSGWMALRDAFTRELPEGAIPSALATIITAIENDTDGMRTTCRDGFRRFVAAIFGPNTTNAMAVAAELGLHPSTLASRFMRAGLPSPKRYLALAKLVRAAYLAEAPGMTISAIAERLQFSSAQSYGRTVRHMTGMTAGEFHHAFNGAAVLERFTADLVTPYRGILRGFDPLSVNRKRRLAAPAGRAA